MNSDGCSCGWTVARDRTDRMLWAHCLHLFERMSTNCSLPKAQTLEGRPGTGKGQARTVGLVRPASSPGNVTWTNGGREPKGNGTRGRPRARHSPATVAPGYQSQGSCLGEVVCRILGGIAADDHGVGRPISSPVGHPEAQAGLRGARQGANGTFFLHSGRGTLI